MVLCATVVARADGPVPDPPVPAEGVARVHLAAAELEPDCHCAVLHARDIESRIDGHVERFEQQTRMHTRNVDKRAQRARALHGPAFVEGFTGFPVRQFRLATDISDDGAGTP
jgi:hypothetical protein